MSAPRKPGRYDPADRPESYALSGAVTTAEERARARIATVLAGHDIEERLLFLRLLGLLDRTEIRTQLAHPERTTA